MNQNGFTESGAQALSLNVAPQITNSLRTVLGADLLPADDRRIDPLGPQLTRFVAGVPGRDLAQNAEFEIEDVG